ncbi:hypothetical protein GWI33_013626 [Rhynchophorus ferrugineus]|uniref:Testis-expressed sequence 9 protein n=1 Tax=Rhynchophorus ferrugineus TaxID=354439 RepID=A0A834I646_RHYFE|nr:hypothetical protein GWI33_013626 [Rhynchophorus ferrugineus]
MESDLLLRENEFRKENEKIQAQTKCLLEKVNDVMKIQDNLIKDGLKTRTEIGDVKRGAGRFDKRSDEEDTGSEEGRGYQGLCRVYRTKLKSLMVEKERVQIELNRKCDELRKQQNETNQLREEKEKWFLAYNGGKNAASKLESQITNLTARIQTKDAELTACKKELDQLKKDQKAVGLNLSSAEVRLSRITEDNDRLRAALKSAKDEERELKETYRKQVNELNGAVKKLERQKFELLNGFKKQIQLIDVLKKEKMHLEALQVSEMAETAYLKILDWKFE